MKWLRIIKDKLAPACVLLCLAACAARHHLEVPHHLAGRRLSNPSAFPPRFQEAISAAASSLPNPEEFYVEVEEAPGPVYVLHLWHQSAFSQENLGKMGNPGGKCRDIRFDPIKKKVLSDLLWQ